MSKIAANSPALDYDDGASEVVDDRPMPTSPPPIEAAAVARQRAGGRMKNIQAINAEYRREVISVRRAGAAPVKMAMPHVHVFQALWRVWQAKRTAAAEDAGVSIGEVSAALAAEGLPSATSSVGATLRSLARNEVVRAVDQHRGFGSRRTHYYPTSAGIELFAMAEVLGHGAFLQVGKTLKSWQRRDVSEPKNLFQHAALIRGGAEPADSVESV